MTFTELDEELKAVVQEEHKRNALVMSIVDMRDACRRAGIELSDGGEVVQAIIACLCH